MKTTTVTDSDNGKNDKVAMAVALKAWIGLGLTIARSWAYTSSAESQNNVLEAATVVVVVVFAVAVIEEEKNN